MDGDDLLCRFRLPLEHASSSAMIGGDEVSELYWQGSVGDGVAARDALGSASLPVVYFATSSSVDVSSMSLIRWALWLWTFVKKLIHSCAAESVVQSIFTLISERHEVTASGDTLTFIASISKVTTIAATAIVDARWATKKKSHAASSIMNWQLSIILAIAAGDSEACNCCKRIKTNVLLVTGKKKDLWVRKSSCSIARISSLWKASLVYSTNCFGKGRRRSFVVWENKGEITMKVSTQQKSLTADALRCRFWNSFEATKRQVIAATWNWSLRSGSFCAITMRSK